MKVIGVIPARYGSTRLEKKPLVDINGKTLIHRVWQSASQSESLTEIIIATDHPDIVEEANSFGARAVLTDPEISTGSGRIAAALDKLEVSWDLAVNVQGDMPFISAKIIDNLIAFSSANFDRFAAFTAGTPILKEEEFLDPNKVKVLVSDTSEALYFSRAPIPFSRDGVRPVFEGQEVYGFRHFGIYAFKSMSLDRFADEQRSTLERVEMLEQLRLLEAGLRIGVCIFSQEDGEGQSEVDTAEDLEKVREASSKP